MEAFKESGSIEYSADVLIGVQFAGTGMGKGNFNVDKAKRANPREMEAVMLKSRNGPAGAAIQFKYYPAFNCFKEG